MKPVWKFEKESCRMAAASDELKQKIAEAIGVEPDRVQDDSKSSDLPEWDSMGIMSIMLMLSDHYGITLAPNQAASLQSVQGIAECIEAHKTN